MNSYHLVGSLPRDNARVFHILTFRVLHLVEIGVSYRVMIGALHTVKKRAFFMG